MPDSLNAVSISNETFRALVGLQQAVKSTNFDEFLLDMAAVYHDIHIKRIDTNLSVRELSCEMVAMYDVAKMTATRGNAFCEVTLEEKVDEHGNTTAVITDVGASYSFGSLRPLYEKAVRRRKLLRNVANSAVAEPG